MNKDYKKFLNKELLDHVGIKNMEDTREGMYRPTEFTDFTLLIALGFSISSFLISFSTREPFLIMSMLINILAIGYIYLLQKKALLDLKMLHLSKHVLDIFNDTIEELCNISVLRRKKSEKPKVH